MMNNKLERIKAVILKTSNKLSVPQKEVVESWDINYEVDLDKEFERLLLKLEQNISLLDQALDRDDLLTGSSALVMAVIASQDLMNLYIDIYDDLMRMKYSDELKGKWPVIPEDFQIPNDYQYDYNLLK